MTTKANAAERTAEREAPVEGLGYTEAAQELDGIIEEFESGAVDVDRLVERLERATSIVDELDRRLRRTRMQVEELVPRLESIGNAAGAENTSDMEEIADGTPDGSGDGGSADEGPPGLF